jgi:hypothetical protein
MRDASQQGDAHEHDEVRLVEGPVASQSAL